MKLSTLVRPLVSAVRNLFTALIEPRGPSQPLPVQQWQAAHVGIATFTDTIYSVSVALPATYDAAGYLAVSPWVVIDRVSDFPMVGSKREIAKWTPIRGPVEKVKSAPDYGGGDIVMADMPLDPGQVILKGAEASQNHFSVKAEYPDGEIHYYDIVVAAWSLAPAKAGEFKTRTASVEFNRKPVEVAAP